MKRACKIHLQIPLPEIGFLVLKESEIFHDACVELFIETGYPEKYMRVYLRQISHDLAGVFHVIGGSTNNYGAVVDDPLVEV